MIKYFNIILFLILNLSAIAQSDIKYGLELPDLGWVSSTSKEFKYSGTGASGFLTGNFKRFGLNIGIIFFDSSFKEPVPMISDTLYGSINHIQFPTLFYFDLLDKRRIKIGIGYQFSFGKLTIRKNEIVPPPTHKLFSHAPVILIRYRLLQLITINPEDNSTTPDGEVKLIGRMSYNNYILNNSSILNHSNLSAVIGLEFQYFNQNKRKKTRIDGW